MPRIPFTIRTTHFLTEQGITLSARRPYLTAQFLASTGQRLPFPAFLDTGSAFSIVPYRLAQHLSWRDLGGQMVSPGKVQRIEWNGVPCRMGEFEVELVDPVALVRTAVLKVLAKIPLQPALPHLEQAAILGMSFLMDNRLREELDATGAALVGSVETS